MFPPEMMDLHQDRPEVCDQLKHAVQLLVSDYNSLTSNIPRNEILEALVDIIRYCGDFQIQSRILNLLICKDDVNVFKKYLANAWFGATPKVMESFFSLLNDTEDITGFLCTFNNNYPPGGLQYVFSFGCSLVFFNNINLGIGKKGPIMLHMNCGTKTLKLSGIQNIPSEFEDDGYWVFKQSLVENVEVYTRKCHRGPIYHGLLIQTSKGLLHVHPDPIFSNKDWQDCEAFLKFVCGKDDLNLIRPEILKKDCDKIIQTEVCSVVEHANSPTEKRSNSSEHVSQQILSSSQCPSFGVCTIENVQDETNDSKISVCTDDKKVHTQNSMLAIHDPSDALVESESDNELLHGACSEIEMSADISVIDHSVNVEIDNQTGINNIPNSDLLPGLRIDKVKSSAQVHESSSAQRERELGPLAVSPGQLNEASEISSSECRTEDKQEDAIKRISDYDCQEKRVSKIVTGNKRNRKSNRNKKIHKKPLKKHISRCSRSVKKADLESFVSAIDSPENSAGTIFCNTVLSERVEAELSLISKSAQNVKKRARSMQRCSSPWCRPTTRSYKRQIQDAGNESTQDPLTPINVSLPHPRPKKRKKIAVSLKDSDETHSCDTVIDYSIQENNHPLLLPVARIVNAVHEDVIKVQESDIPTILSASSSAHVTDGDDVEKISQPFVSAVQCIPQTISVSYGSSEFSLTVDSQLEDPLNVAEEAINPLKTWSSLPNLTPTPNPTPKQSPRDETVDNDLGTIPEILSTISHKLYPVSNTAYQSCCRMEGPPPATPIHQHAHVPVELQSCSLTTDEKKIDVIAYKTPVESKLLSCDCINYCLGTNNCSINLSVKSDSPVSVTHL